MAINPLFNANYYLANNADLVRAGLHTEEQLWNHYVQYGAQEGFLNGAAIREPNAWFNVNYYLAANPDLLAGGVTAPTALDHFLTYGISENREFSATLSLSEFTAAKYASENKDLREAFDIADDFTELTAEQKTALITHYLSYGYAEDRKGAGAEFEKVVTAKNEITVAAADTLSQGTIVDDEFTVTAAPTTGTPPAVTIDGLGGNDTVVFNNTANITAGVTLKNIEEVVAKGAGAVTFDSQQLLNKITLDAAAATAVTANFANNLVSGSADVLNVVSKATVGVVTVNGFETVNLTANGAAGSTTIINANEAKGASLTVNVDGGKADVGGAVMLNSLDSPTIETVTIDASANAGNLFLLAGVSLAAVKNVVMVGGAGDNSFINNAANAKVSFTATGGAGDDTFNASKAIDTFTGGAGDDIFTFAAGNALIRTKTVDGKVVVDAVDTVVDFKAGDTLKLLAPLTEVKFATGTLPADATLEEALTHTSVLNNSIFQWGADAYVVVTKAVAAGTVDTGMEVIKLTGVNVSDLTITATDIVFA